MDKERKNSSPDGNGTVPDVAGPTAGEIPAPASERPDAAPDGDAAVRRREIARKALKWTLYAVWFGLFLYLTVCHEEFRDEAQSWMFAKHNSLLGMMKNCWEEGHPWLWHLLLKPFTALGFPYAGAKYIGFALTAAAMAVYCRRSPFPLPVTAATMFLEYSYYCNFARS